MRLESFEVLFLDVLFLRKRQREREKRERWKEKERKFPGETEAETETDSRPSFLFPSFFNLPQPTPFLKLDPNNNNNNNDNNNNDNNNNDTRRTVDVLREVRAAKAAGRRPYVITFVGVNGVGKSTSLSKVAYWLSSNGVKVSIAACDTFRAGAVEQLKTHAARLRVPLFERGYEKDPAKVAAEAVRAAARDGVDCVLVDTAGRMQDNEPLMRALAGLISSNDPDLVLFVGEALVGNDGVDQLTQFNARLLDLAPPRNGSGKGSSNHNSTNNNGSGSTNDDDENAAGTTVREGRPCAVDGIVLTKFDTIDDKVGAAVSMVYASGAPVMFVGCGQTYVDLKRLNVRSVVRSLLQ